MNCWITGSGVISPQRTHAVREFLPESAGYEDNVLTCMLPEFSDYMNPLQMRRLGRTLRMGLAAATICLREAGVSTPDAIITASGYGFQEDMGAFLAELLDQDEQQLTPTCFIQSTHNALSGLLALSMKCMGYNTAYAGKGCAFEAALQDAMMLVRDGEAQNVLVGAVEEAYWVQRNEYARLGYLKREKIKSLRLFESQTEGTLLGEGVAFFLLSGASAAPGWCRMRDLRMVYGPADYGRLSAELMDFLGRNHLAPRDVDVLVNGASGDVARDKPIHDLRRDHFGSAADVRFKHLTGEYATAASFALWLGAKILKTQTLPEAVLAAAAPSGRPPQTVLVLNHFLGKDYSFALLTKE